MKHVGLVVMLAIIFSVNTSFYGDVYSKSDYYIIIDKSEYELRLYDAEGWLITYPVVFGSKDQGDKLVQGDRKTPEGSFTIVNKRVHNKWSRYMGLDYPTPPDMDKFNLRKQQGIIPASAQIGAGIGIHGTWQHEDYAIDLFDNWTMGCISMKNDQVQQLYNMVPIGTRVTIVK